MSAKRGPKPGSWPGAGARRGEPAGEADQQSAEPAIGSERTAFFPSFGEEERLRSFRADGYRLSRRLAGRRPAGRRRRAWKGIDGWRDGGKSAVSAIRRRRTLLCKSVGNGSSPNKGMQATDAREWARDGAAPVAVAMAAEVSGALGCCCVQRLTIISAWRSMRAQSASASSWDRMSAFSASNAKRTA